MGIYDNRLIRLDFGEPSFSPPPEAKSEAIKYINNPTHQYAPLKGDINLLTKIKHYLEQRYYSTIDKSYLTITSGGLMGLNTIIRCLKEKGVSKVYYPDPGFPPYQFMGRYIGIEMNSYPMVKEEDVVKKLSTISKNEPDGTCAFLITSPNNPNGLTLSTRSLEDITGMLNKQYIIFDNSFESFFFNDNDGKQLKFGYNIFHSFSFSKSFSLADYRIGFIVAPNDVWANEIARSHWFSQLSTSVIAQKAAIGALNCKVDYLPNNKEMVKKNIDQAIKSLNSKGIEVIRPDGGFFLWVNIQELRLSADEFVQHAFENYQLSIISGKKFGANGEGYIRINCATDQLSLYEGVERLIKCYRERANNYEHSL